MANKYDCPQIQEELISKLKSLFERENLEKDVYFIARMKEKLEIPLQVVYQQKDIYRICPNGRYVLKALINCPNIIVNEKELYIVPKIQARKTIVYLRIFDVAKVNISEVIQHISKNFSQGIVHTEKMSISSAFLTLESEEKAEALAKWVQDNLLKGEPQEVLMREENLYSIFKHNVKEELKKYYNKLNEDKKAVQMFENLSFFQNTQAPIVDKKKAGENVFSNPFNYFFYQQPAQENNHLPFGRKNNIDTNTKEAQNAMNLIMFQQQAMMMAVQNAQNQNNGRRNHHQQEQTQEQEPQQKNEERNKLKKNKNKKRGGAGEKDSEKFVFNNKTANKKSSLKQKYQKPVVDNEENFPSLTNQGEAQTISKNESTKQPNRPTRKQSEEGHLKNQERNDISSEAKKREKTKERQVSESRDRQTNKIREKSQSKKEEVVYIRKAKSIQITYEKDTLLSIFKSMKDTICPPESIIESSKDDFIPVVNINAQREIEHTKPTEVDLTLSNPNTPYSGAQQMPFRKRSISRSNIKRKESEKIIEVDENKLA